MNFNSHSEQATVGYRTFFKEERRRADNNQNSSMPLFERAFALLPKRFNIWHLAVAIAVVAVIAKLSAVPPRPMFHEIYGRNDRMLLRRWVPSPPTWDLSGEYMAFLDEERNVLLVTMLPPNADDAAVVMRWGKAYLQFNSPSTGLIEVPRTRDVMLFATLGDKLTRTRLLNGEARVAFDAFDSKEFEAAAWDWGDAKRGR